MKIKTLIKKYLPEDHHNDPQSSAWQRRMFQRLRGQNIWHLNRRSVSNAAFIAMFCAMLPMPGQMLLATAMALMTRAHLPLSLAGTWVTNPFTYVPIFIFNYKIGLLLTGNELLLTQETIVYSELYENLSSIIPPLIIGSLAVGMAAGSIAFVVVRLYWRFNIWQMLKTRRERRRQKKRIKREKKHRERG